MRYRCILVGVEGLERPKQSFFQTVPSAENWAKLTIENLTDEQQKTAEVIVYQIQERHYLTVRAKETVRAFPAKPCKATDVDSKA